ncbi:hypothetical protein COLO4_34412, partial [Corchorus olitorius]
DALSLEATIAAKDRIILELQQEVLELRQQLDALKASPDSAKCQRLIDVHARFFGKSVGFKLP